MSKRFIINTLIIFVLWMIGSMIVHGMLLHDSYAQLPNLFRSETESQQYFPLMILAHVILSGALVWIYARGREDKPWLAQGVRFGLAIVFLTIVPTYMIYYAVQPMPGALVVKQILFDGALIWLLGIIVAFLHRNASQ